MHISPRVFISATSADLGSVRQLVKEALLSMDCHPVEQTNFPPDYRTVQDMLQDKIRSCQAVVHVVGMRYGAEPDAAQLPPGVQRRSFTQMEYDLARQLGKKLYVFLCPPDFPYDACGPEPEELSRLQRTHRDALHTDKHLHNQVATREELGVRVREMQLELEELRRHVRRSNRTLFAGIAAILLALAAVGYGAARTAGIVGGVPEQIEDVTKQVAKSVAEMPQKTIAEIHKLYEDPDVMVGKLKSHIRQRADEQIVELRKDSSNWRKIDEIEKQRDRQLENVEEVVASIRAGLSGDPDPIFAEAARILAEQGVDEALEYLQAKQPAIEDRVRATKAKRAQAEEDFRASLEPWLMEADLHKQNLAWEKARQRYEQVAAEAPQWSRARRKLGDLLRELALFNAAEPHLKGALDLADDDSERASAANNLGVLYLQQARCAEAEPLLQEYLQLSEKLYGHDYATSATALNNLAQLLKATNRLAEAEPLMRRALAIDEQSYGAEHPSVARDLNNLAQLLQATNRLAEAKPLMRRALAIDERSYGAEHPEVAIRLNNLAQLLKATNRLAEAEPLLRRALAIDEQSFGPEHPDIARDLNNLAQLLQDTNRLAEAEPLMRRALAIDEQSYGAEHPSVARDLNNLAQLLQATNRLAEAEPLMRRALAIDEQSYGPDHPNAAIRLNNLAQLLKATNRLAEAEPLYRRALAIDEQSYGAEHPSVARNLNNLAQLLQATNRLAEAEPLYRRALAIDEQSHGPDHPNAAIRLNNLAFLLQATNRLAEAEPLGRRCLEIFVLFGKATGFEHPRFKVARRNYTGILKALEIPEEEIEQKLAAIRQVERPLKPMVPEIERLLGPAKPVEEVLAALDEQYKRENKPAIYFLPAHEPIAPHLDELLGPEKLNVVPGKSLAASIDELLGPAKLDVPAGEPISPHLDKLLGPSKLALRADKTLAQQVDELLGPSKLDVPLGEPISPHLDKLLGPSLLDVPLDEPISPHLERLLGPVEETATPAPTRPLPRPTSPQGR